MSPKSLIGIVALIFGCVISEAAPRADVSVEANAYSASGCAYFSQTLSDLRFTFSDSLHSGSRVRVRFGFLNKWGGELHWQKTQEVEMTLVAPDTWSATVKEQSVAVRGSSFFSHVEFEILVTEPGDREISQSAPGYWAAPIPSSECKAGELVALPLSFVRR